MVDEWNLTAPTLVYYMCNVHWFRKAGDADTKNGVLDELITLVSSQNYAFYAHGSCSDFLGISDCDNCVGWAGYYTRTMCRMSIRAQFQLPDCKVRYEVYDFKE